MARKKDASFEVLVVLAIVAIVAVTGQVLIQFDLGDDSRNEELQQGNSVTGYSVADETQGPLFTDVAIKSISVNPGSPLSGQPFEIVVSLENKGTTTIAVPFYVGLEVMAMPRQDSEYFEPLVLEAASSKLLVPGDVAELSFYMSVSTGEGPVRITAFADTTSKLFDAYMGNNQMSKTIVLAE